MGGQNQGTVQGQGVGGRLTDIRFHENAGMAHFHDDTGQVKVEVPIADWHNAQRDLEAAPCRREFQDGGATLVVESFEKNGKRDVKLEMTAPQFDQLPMSTKLTELSKLVTGS